ncbi:hypothetical protein ACJRO7_028993 [Eucalyptus globulus]|uniref:DUF7722 domain-containing protein n=1 Tax=Eucalyptus globulus TaxID=34317 RepID=A0ABD3K1I6_EUCGL
MDQIQRQKRGGVSRFQMPLHYPKYTSQDYRDMPEWKLDCLLAEYGLPITGDLSYKRDFAMGAFLWPDCHQDPRPSSRGCAQEHFSSQESQVIS